MQQVLDKSLLDCMFYCSHEVQLSSVTCMVKEVQLICISLRHCDRWQCFRVLAPGGLAVFVTKQSPDRITKKLGWTQYDAHWCGLDWTVEAKPMYIPFVNECGLMSNDSLGVHDPSDLSLEKRQYGCKLLYMYIAHKSSSKDDD